MSAFGKAGEGWATGVGMAGALREIAALTIPRDLRHVDTSTTRVLLLEGNHRLLPGKSTRASRRAQEHLVAMGVEVRLGAFVTDVVQGAVFVGEEKAAAANVIWAAGVQGSSLARTLGTELDRQGRAKVEEDCSVPGHPEAFVIGDVAAMADPETKEEVPGVGRLVDS